MTAIHFYDENDFVQRFFILKPIMKEWAENQFNVYFVRVPRDENFSHSQRNKKNI